MKTTRNLLAVLALASFTVAFAGAPGMMAGPHANAAQPKAGACGHMDSMNPMDSPKAEARMAHHGDMDMMQAPMQASVDHCVAVCATTERKEAKKAPAKDPIDHYYLSVD